VPDSAQQSSGAAGKKLALFPSSSPPALALKREKVYMSVDFEMLKEENIAFYERWERSLRHLFDKARETHELWFAFSLNPEFRGSQDPGWSMADDAMVAFEEYLQFINEAPVTSLKAKSVHMRLVHSPS
jgi:hypothetical protein